MIEFILDDLLRTDSFKTPEREKLWRYLWYARRVHGREPAVLGDGAGRRVCRGGATIAVGRRQGRNVPLGPQVFAKRGEVYAVYLPTCSATGTLDLTDLKGTAKQRWFNPRTGEFVGGLQSKSPAVRGGSLVTPRGSSCRLGRLDRTD